jgi:hypothetical protein
LVRKEPAMHTARTRNLPLALAALIVCISLAARECAPTEARTVAAGRDCNANGIEDALDIANGTSSDLDSDGVPDECGCR